MNDIEAKYGGTYTNSDQRHYAQGTMEGIFGGHDLSLQELKDLRDQAGSGNVTSIPWLTTLNQKRTEILNTIINHFEVLDKNKNAHVNLSEVNNNLQLIAGVTSSSTSSKRKKELLLVMMMMSMYNKAPTAAFAQPLLPKPTSPNLFGTDLSSLFP